MIHAKKGGAKILFLLLIVVAIGASAMIFGFDTHPISEEVQDKAQNVISEEKKAVVEKVVDEGRRTVGEKLKETGEKILDGSETEESGIYDDLDVDRFEFFEKNILFFTAQWCPSCLEADEKFSQSVSAIPSDVALWRVDYDSHEDLRDKYQIDTAHVFIIVDAEGNEMQRWSGSMTIDDVIAEINK
jgi:thiol-disulfide isomerase/thioredoxin